MTENEIGSRVVEAAIAVHRALGPGLLESVYEAVLAHDLQQQGLTVERQVALAITYKGMTFEEGFRADLIVEKKGDTGAEVSGASESGTQEAGLDLPETERTQVGLPVELR